MTKIHRFETQQAWAESAAAWIATAIEVELLNHERVALALAGGSTPLPVYRRLASHLSGVGDLTRLHLFWGDERCVPLDDPRSNAGQAMGQLVRPAGLSSDQVHAMTCQEDPAAAAQAYAAELEPFLSDGGHGLGLVLLGLGSDGHTASLFPGGNWIRAEAAWVVSVPSEANRLARLSLTPAAINRARRVAFLVTGADKAAAVRSVMTGAHDPDRWPAQAIHPRHGELHWFLDEAAAAEL